MLLPLLTQKVVSFFSLTNQCEPVRNKNDTVWITVIMINLFTVFEAPSQAFDTGCPLKRLHGDDLVLISEVLDTLLSTWSPKVPCLHG